MNSRNSSRILAAQATLHCLTGCAIGEILGMILGAAFSWNNLTTIVVSIILAFIFGYSLSLRTVLRGGVAIKQAVPIVLASDTLSITAMEVADNTVIALVPGALHAGLTDGLFWWSMALSLAVAFIAAFPVNWYLLSRGKGHALLHQHMGH